MGGRGRKRVLSSDDDEPEIIDNPRHQPPRKIRQSNIEDALIKVDEQLINKTQKVVTDMTRTNYSIVDAIQEFHALDRKITDHEAIVQRYLEDNVDRRERCELQPVGAHRSSWEQLKPRFASIVQGILEHLEEVTNDKRSALDETESLREEVASNKATAPGNAHSLEAAMNEAIESLGKAVESLKNDPGKDIQLSPEFIRKAIEEPAALSIKKAFEDVTKHTQPLEKLLQSVLRAQKCNEPTKSIRIDCDSKKVHSSNFFYKLKDIDFRPPSGMWNWVNITWQLLRYDLWGNESFRYLLQFNLKAPVCLERHWRGHDCNHSSRDYLGSPEVLWYCQNVMEIEAEEEPPAHVSTAIPKYVIYLGDLLVHTKISDDGHPSYETSENNMCLVMDITKPSKSLWLVYKYEYQSARELCEFEFHPDWKSFPNVETQLDLVSIANGIGDWKEGNQEFPYQHLDNQQVEDTMRRTACRVKPVFTRPKLDDVLQAIEDGWVGYEDGQVG
ncbi:hypothetical protein SLS62_008242 [Diatrype stigma]|uniref:Uncharacterized protein n=1 Tax=Diatrype stigma TaxID=117547 RepID=A0AAN9UW28_9PEZI